MTPEPRLSRPVAGVTRAVPAELLDRFAAAGLELRLHDSVAPLHDGLAEFLSGVSAAMLAPYDRIDAVTLRSCPGLRVVANASAGHDNLDLAACSARGIIATRSGRLATLRQALENVVAGLEGDTPPNLLNPDSLLRVVPCVRSLGTSRAYVGTSADLFFRARFSPSLLR